VYCMSGEVVCCLLRVVVDEYTGCRVSLLVVLLVHGFRSSGMVVHCLCRPLLHTYPTILGCGQHLRFRDTFRSAENWNKVKI
jgi:hypothetical protein